MNTIPIFPLNTVLFPEGILPLRIFEARYIDMVSESMRAQTPFGICLITQGNEVGVPAEFHPVGTLAHIIDWEQHEDGLLGITVQGGRRFQVINRRIRKNNLQEGDIELIDEYDDEELPVEFQLLADLLQQIADRFRLSHLTEKERYLDANWVSCRLAELLPLDMSDKQILLEKDDPIDRLQVLQVLLQDVSIDQFNN